MLARDWHMEQIGIVVVEGKLVVVVDDDECETHRPVSSGYWSQATRRKNIDKKIQKEFNYSLLAICIQID